MESNTPNPRRALFKKLFQELRKAHRAGGFQTGPTGFPLLFSVGSGKVIPVTEVALQTIELLVIDLWETVPYIHQITNRAEFRKIVHGGLGPMLDGFDLSADRTKSADALDANLVAHVETEFQRDFGSLEFAYGADLFGSGATPTIEIGPVCFEPRAIWLERQSTLKKISSVSSRRIKRAWSGKRLRKRKPSYEAAREDAVLRSVGTASYVCSVRTSGISQAVAEDKGRTAARVAITTVALLWPTTSKTLEWMRLRYDGRPISQDYVCFGERGRWGASSGTSGLQHGLYVSEAAWTAGSDRHAYLFRVVGRSLTLLCDPVRTRPSKRLVLNFYHALWWYGAAAREADPLVAIVKFVAALEVLSAGEDRRGGDGRAGIMRLLKARLGIEKEQIIFLGGKPTEALVSEIYDSARNRTIHGSNERLFEDWTPLSAQAAAITRRCLLAAAKMLDGLSI